ncbi:relaxase/mobilization nuclease domain-containing protein [Arthrobacter sp. B0490]|uniref:relaxase/mobilization nuclease domain-containing protein n=1 Tax=Arthrobacter sp. B0490 TaxID=2058891 RepID=UPI000CE49D4B|nr:relaxase/mobilization nuclease domain-containing protein [Arthrobacter sp. B0490]
MIPNITKGSRTVGLMKYLVGPGKRNEHTDPHLVTGSPVIMSWFDDAQINDQSAVLVADEIDLNKRINDVEMDSHVWHCSLSLRADERPVSDREWADMAEKFMDDVGFTGSDGKAPCQWVAVHHGTSTAGNDHIHIVASRVREDGTKWSDWSDFPKAQAAARNLEKQFGLIELGQHSERGLKPAEQLTDRRTGNTIEPARHRMERVVRASAVASESEAEFVRRLRRQELLVSARFADGGRSVVTGYSVAERPPKGMDPVWFGGGKLAKDLTLPALRTAWTDTPEASQEAAEEWWAAKRHHRIVHNQAPDMRRGIRASMVGGVAVDEVATRKLALDMAKARRVMSQVDPSDHQTWAHVAREASGVFGAWSKATEAEPGPLAHASRVLARSAHRSGVTISKPVNPGLRMAGTTAFLLAAATAPSPVAQTLIMQQMLRTIRLLHDMQASNKELREATLLTETVREHLSIVGAPLPEVPEPRLPAPATTQEPAVGVERKAVPSLTEAKPPQRVQRLSEHYEAELHMSDQGIGR